MAHVNDRGAGSCVDDRIETQLAGLSTAQRVAQMLMIGVPGPELTPECGEFFAGQGFGGAIIFGRNCVDLTQVRALTAGLQGLAAAAPAGLPLLISTDQEGGIVARLTEAHGAVVMPGAMALGATGEPDLARQAAAATARLLRSVGINMNLAPVADVNNAAANPVINVRSFGEDPACVAAFVTAAVAGCQGAGVLATAKHFPGHGDTNVDSHFAMPVVPHGRERLDAVELVPFRAAIAAGAGVVMTSHILFPAVANDGLPATLSRAVLTGLLREELGHDGLIISDCMEMAAIVDNYGTAPAAVLAIKAGADMICVSHTPARQREAYAAVLAAVEAGEIPAAQVAASVRRILRAKAAYAVAPAALLTAPEQASQRELALAIARRAVTLLRDRGDHLPLQATRPLCVHLGLGARGPAESAEKIPTDLADALRPHYPDLRAVTVADDGDGLAAALNQLKHADALILAVAGTAARPERAALAERLQVAAGERPVILAGCRTPYDADALAACDCALVAYDSRPSALVALAEAIAGRLTPTGHAPVTCASTQE